MLRGLLLRMMNAYAAKDSPDAVMRALGNLRGKRIGDIGSGGGYYSLRFARAAGPKGRVYAIDIDPGSLEYTARLARREGLANLEPVLGRDSTVPLPPGSVDLFFSRESFHHLSRPDRYFARLKPLLSRGGKVAVIDFRKGGGFSWPVLFGHFTPPETVRRTLEKAGFVFEKSIDLFRHMSFQIFRRAPASGRRRARRRPDSSG